MENIDDFMRQKFDSDDPADRFEFREEFWEQAQALIEADEARRRKRRRWLIWWFFAGLLVAVGSWQLSVGNWYGAAGRGQEMVGRAQEAEAEGRETTESRQGTGKNRETGDKDQETETGDRRLSAAGREQGTEANEGAGGNRQPAIGKEQAMEDRIEVKGGNRTKNTSAKGRPLKKTDRPATLSAQELQRQSGKNAGTGDNISTSGSETGGNRITTGEAGKDAKNAGDQPSTDTAPDTPDEAGAAQAPALRAFPVPLKALACPPRPFDTVTVQVAAPLIKPHREHRLHFGLTAGASLYEPTADGRRLGWSGGVFAGFRFNPAWSVSLGLQGRFQPGDKSLPGDSLSSYVLRYSFGYQEDTWTLERRGLCFVEAPLSVQWRWRAFGVEGGIVPGILLGARGRLIREHSASLQEDASITQRGVWIDDAPYRRIYTSGFFGASWYMNRRLEFSARGFYRPGNVLKVPDAGAPGRQLSVDLGLRFHF